MIVLIGVNSFALLCAGGTGGTPPPNVWGDTWGNFLFWLGSWEAWDIWHGVEIDFELEYGTVWYPWWDNIA